MLQLIIMMGSMMLANNIYFMLKFGQILERETGSATHLWFLITQTIILSLFGKYDIMCVSVSINTLNRILLT